MPNLRERLRAGTRAHHEDVDAAFSQLDLRERDGLASFLSAQGAALQAIRCASGRHAAEAGALRDEMLAAAEADFRHLGYRAERAPTPVDLHPTAVLYILLGSALGAQVLRRRWLASGDPLVQGAGAYFGLPLRAAAWRLFCEEAAATPAQGEDADVILRDANRIFDLYLAALPPDQARPPIRSRIET